jgi:hypothetical protein
MLEAGAAGVWGTRIPPFECPSLESHSAGQGSEALTNCACPEFGLPRLIVVPKGSLAALAQIPPTYNSQNISLIGPGWVVATDDPRLKRN